MIFLKGLNITADQKKVILKACYSFYEAAAELLQSEHSSLRLMEHENSKTLNAKGELSDGNLSSYEKLCKSYDHLHFMHKAQAIHALSYCDSLADLRQTWNYVIAYGLAEALDMQPPVMPEDGHTTRVTSGEEVVSSVVEPIWDDEDTRAFYECLPDLRNGAKSQ
ncbi:hypothetical protein TSUD_274050 [Trifolium subterraneum]|uniref:Uncharacterized protein n=1 Tax=Trifolium subterraneum TaxID=3900 RepID=A0A2Z6M0E4_TRISU|nr:hypothetical protein TSUD_274050 [Trifolium subterraneum]